MKQIIISGITGFIGSNLDKYLKDYVVAGVTRGKNHNPTMLSYDELAQSGFNKASAFVHLAAIAHDVKGLKKAEDYITVNTELTKKLFDQFLASDCSTFIYLSSVKAVAESFATGFLQEGTKPNPLTHYGKSKLAAENYILANRLPANKRVYVLRPCSVHGPNNKGNLDLLFKSVLHGIHYPFGRYDNQRSFASVENLCFIIGELIENKAIPSGIYNIADDDPLSTNELVTMMGEGIGRPPKIINIPKPLINILVKMGDILHLPLNSQRLTKSTENYCVSNDKIKKALGKELPLTSRQGLHKTIEWFFEQSRS